MVIRASECGAMWTNTLAQETEIHAGTGAELSEIMDMVFFQDTERELAQKPHTGYLGNFTLAKYLMGCLCVTNATTGYA